MTPLEKLDAERDKVVVGPNKELGGWTGAQIRCLRNTAVRSLVGEKGRFSISNAEEGHVITYHDNPEVDKEGGGKEFAENVSGHVTLRVTDDQVTAEMARIQKEFDDAEYQRDRRKEYPSWPEQLNKIYDDGIDKWKTEMVDPVKAKIPKP